jgi:hypothetical protein
VREDVSSENCAGDLERGDLLVNSLMSELASLLHVLSTPLGDLLSFAGGGDVKTDELDFVFGALIVLGLAVVVASLLAGGVRGEEGVEERGEAMLAALVAPTSFLIGDVLTARLERGVDGSETAKVGIKLGVGTSAAPRLFCLPRTCPCCLDRKDVSSAIVTHRSEIASPNSVTIPTSPEPSSSSSSSFKFNHLPWSIYKILSKQQ